MENRFLQLVNEARRNDRNWDFDDTAANSIDQALESVPGLVVMSILNDPVLIDSERVVGLLASYCARRSLVCWFKYCTSTAPLIVSDRTISYWLSLSDCTVSLFDSDYLPEVPYSDGERILDCRASDTTAASSAVASSAKYTKTRSAIDAVLAISNSHIAFDVSPIGSSRNFETWLLETAIPNAYAIRRFSSAVLFEHADFTIPPQMQYVP